MSSILDQVKLYETETSQLIARMESILKESPGGSLIMLRRKNHRYFFHRTREGGKRIDRYIPKDNVSALKPLALKRCAVAAIPKLRMNLKAAGTFIKYHSGLEGQDILDGIAPEILAYCGELYTRKDEAIREWMNCKSPEEPLYELAPTIETTDGKMVRSKSEALIYNSLLANGITFLYEKALYLPDKPYPVFPDFTVLDPVSMREIYWEHFGIMDDPDYLDRALEKMSSYNRNGIFPGSSLICTFESRKRPLSSADVERLIAAMLRMEK